MKKREIKVGDKVKVTDELSAFTPYGNKYKIGTIHTVLSKNAGFIRICSEQPTNGYQEHKFELVEEEYKEVPNAPEVKNNGWGV